MVRATGFPKERRRVAKYPFLSSEWIEEARKIHEKYGSARPTAGLMVRMNQVITEVPFGSGTIEARMDTSSGELEIELGHLEAPNVTVTMDYATAKEVYVDGNVQSGMQAFMSGKIKTEGDISKLMAMQTLFQPSAADQATLEAVAEIKDMTA